MSDKLYGKDKFEIAVQSGMQLIPYVGGAMATAYFGSKQEKRFKRIESFYQEIYAEFEGFKEGFKDFQEHNTDAIIAIMEEFNEALEREHTSQKREYFKKYLKNTLINPVTNNFDERKFFLETLGGMSLLECEVLIFLNHNYGSNIRVGAIEKPGINQYAIVGAIGKLKSHGFVQTGQGSMTIGSGLDNMLNEIVSISSFGQVFCKFCLE
ncbi:hypothetical protein HF078_06765 [Bacillus sp. RO2]|uniref:hypothetical protein n=1 Tax=Bacillus sp. RO2 TaxID=2723913 RepID=UPI00145DF6DC|nr:hypothetical protein [Bacillus sp. RO2]NMH72768.1 hypothetical protein [Bacillus sp. RO2]